MNTFWAEKPCKNSIFWRKKSYKSTFWKVQQLLIATFLKEQLKLLIAGGAVIVIAKQLIVPTPAPSDEIFHLSSA